MSKKVLSNAGKMGLVSFKFSNAGINSWERPISYITKTLKSKQLKPQLIVKIFGRDEIWAITSIKDCKTLESLEKEPIVDYTASLEKPLDFNIEIIEKIQTQGLPVGYLFFRKADCNLSYTRNFLKNKNGLPFLLGEIYHPRGFTHFVAFTVSDGSVLSLAEFAHELMRQFDCMRWECFLGVKHSWMLSRNMTSKFELAKRMGKQILDRIKT